MPSDGPRTFGWNVQCGGSSSSCLRLARRPVARRDVRVRGLRGTDALASMACRWGRCVCSCEPRGDGVSRLTRHRRH